METHASDAGYFATVAVLTNEQGLRCDSRGCMIESFAGWAMSL